MSAAFALMLFAVAAPPPALVDDAAAEVEYDRVREEFGHVPRARSLAALEAVAAAHATAPASGRALLWLGDLALRDHQGDDAGRHYAEAHLRFPHGEIGALGLRGLGDVAYFQGRYTDAIPLFEAALAEAPPVLAIELRQKRAIAFESRRRFGYEIGAWLVLGLVAAWFCRRALAQRDSLHFPVEAQFLLPLYALLVAACWGRDAGVRHALYWLSLGSLALVTLAFAPTARRRLSIDAALLTLANLALFYVAIRRAGIVDVLWTTIKAGADAE